MEIKEKFNQSKKVIADFNEQVKDYTSKNSLNELPAFDELQKKEVIGDIYREDQVYYETISDFRSKYFGLESFFIKMRSETSDRVLVREIDEMIKYVSKKEEMLRSLSYTAKDRIKFYQNVIYLVANMTYGDF
jgi:hypothetical protein